MQLMLSVSVAVDVDTSRLQLNMTVILSVIGFLSDKCLEPPNRFCSTSMTTHTHIATHTETTDTESKIKVKLLHIFQIDYDGFFYLYVFYVTESFGSKLPKHQRLISQPQKLLNPVWTLKRAFVDFHIIKLSYLNYDEIIYALVKDVAKYLIFGNKKFSFVGAMVLTTETSY